MDEELSKEVVGELVSQMMKHRDTTMEEDAFYNLVEHLGGLIKDDGTIWVPTWTYHLVIPLAPTMEIAKRLTHSELDKIVEIFGMSEDESDEYLQTLLNTLRTK